MFGLVIQCQSCCPIMKLHYCCTSRRRLQNPEQHGLPMKIFKHKMPVNINRQTDHPVTDHPRTRYTDTLICSVSMSATPSSAILGSPPPSHCVMNTKPFHDTRYKVSKSPGIFPQKIKFHKVAYHKTHLTSSCVAYRVHCPGPRAYHAVLYIVPLNMTL